MLRCTCAPATSGCELGTAARAPSRCLRSAFVGRAVRQPPARTRRAARGQVTTQALDAAMPFDFEARMEKRMSQTRRLKIGIVGFGTFGQFIAKRLVEAGHEVIATSRTPYFEEAKKIGVEYFTDADDFCEEHPHVVILATAIIATGNILKALPLQRLRRNTLFVDVLSVKVFPKQLFLKELPRQFDILCTHPMFGPESGKGSWENLAFVYDKVRVGSDRKRQERLEVFLEFWRSQGCRMVEMTCEEHDRQAASTQFITHTVGRVLGGMEIHSTQINTKGFESLLNLMENTANDSFDLYYGLFMYNPNATDELERMERAFDEVKKALFTRLHDVARAQLMHVPPTSRKELLPGATSRGSEASVGTSIVPAGSNGGEAAMAVRSRGEGKEGLGVPVVRGEVVGGMVNGAGEAKGGRP